MHNKRSYEFYSAYCSGAYSCKWSKSKNTRHEIVNRLARTNVDADSFVSTFDKVEGIDITDRFTYYLSLDKYLIKTPTGKLVDKEKLLKDIAKAKGTATKSTKRRTRYKNSYTYRKDPVPHVHRYSWNRGSLYRITKVHHSIIKDSEYPEFSKVKNRMLANVRWDEEPIRHLDRSWKTSCKVRKQWMKHLKKHADTLTTDYYNNELNEVYED